MTIIKHKEHKISMDFSGLFYLKRKVSWWKLSWWTIVDSGSFESMEHEYKKVQNL